MTSLNQLTSSTKSDLCNVVHVDLSNEDDTTVSEPPPKKQLLESNASDPSHHNNSSNNLVSSVGSSLRASPFAEEFKDPAVLSRIQERIKTHLQITVTQSINSVLHDVTVAVDRVNQLKKNTEDLQKRLVHLETVSRKVERLVNESIPLSQRQASSSNDLMQQSPSAFATHLVHSQPQDITSINSNVPSRNHVQPGPANSRQRLVAPPSSSSSSSSQIVNNSQQNHSSAPTPTPESGLKQNQSPVSMAMAYVNHLANQPLQQQQQQRPVAPLPPTWKSTGLMQPPVQPSARLSISAAAEGVCLRWDLDASHRGAAFEPATTYQLYSYASSDVDPRKPLTSQIWQKVGDIEALPLPMACTLTSVLPDNVYYFVVRSVDGYRRSSDWSNVVNASVS